MLSKTGAGRPNRRPRSSRFDRARLQCLREKPRFRKGTVSTVPNKLVPRAVSTAGGNTSGATALLAVSCFGMAEAMPLRQIDPLPCLRNEKVATHGL